MITISSRNINQLRWSKFGYRRWSNFGCFFHGLIQIVENLWDKYAVSSRELEDERSETLKTLDGFLKGLGYVKEEA